jgi:hypothetical protein
VRRGRQNLHRCGGSVSVANFASGLVGGWPLGALRKP